MSALRDRLPSKGQINALTDERALRDLMDDVEAEIVRMETDLQFRDDEEWASRARGALAVHRQTFRVMARRLATLKAAAARTSTAVRPEDACDPLTVEVFRRRPGAEAGADGIDDLAEIDRRLAWLADRINAVTTDREDEIGLPAAERDEKFMVITGSVLRSMKAQRQQLQTRRGQISKALKKAETAARGDTRERLFIDAAREVLTREQFLAVWDRVDRLEVQEKAA